MEECIHLFYDQDFEEMVDNNKKLLGFENGVIDFETKHFEMEDQKIIYLVLLKINILEETKLKILIVKRQKL